MFRVLVILGLTLYDLRNTFRSAIREREKVEMKHPGSSSVSG
jgi:hypothetical protein